MVMPQFQDFWAAGIASPASVKFPSRTYEQNMLDAPQCAYDREVRRLDNVRNQKPSILGAPGTIDAWRQRRMYELVRPIIDAHRDGTWLTIGDSGGDAFFLQSCGVADVTASSISSQQLSALKQHGHLTGVALREINAERIDCESDSFDIIYCKEAYHHLPRPAMGLYEMIRVARKCVILCEPCDHGGKPFDWLRVQAKSILRGQGVKFQSFEPVGNFIFPLSERETIKIATALTIGPVFFRHFSDFYHPVLSKKGIDELLPRTIAKLAISVQDALSWLRLMSYARVCAIIWKQPPAGNVLDRLQNGGFRRVDVLRNPYRSLQGADLK
jgi:SAM-dependent methyltransferase